MASRHILVSPMDHLVSPVPLQRSQARLTATNALWGHILRKTGSSQVPPSTATSTSTLGKHTSTIAPIDKAGASTRILLHDTQAHLERFTDRVSELVTDLDCAKRELVGVQKLYAEDHEQLMDRMIGLSTSTIAILQGSHASDTCHAVKPIGARQSFRRALAIPHRARKSET